MIQTGRSGYATQPERKPLPRRTDENVPAARQIPPRKARSPESPPCDVEIASRAAVQGERCPKRRRYKGEKIDWASIAIEDHPAPLPEPKERREEKRFSFPPPTPTRTSALREKSIAENGQKRTVHRAPREVVPAQATRSSILLERSNRVALAKREAEEARKQESVAEEAPKPKSRKAALRIFRSAQSAASVHQVKDHMKFWNEWLLLKRQEISVIGTKRREPILYKPEQTANEGALDAPVEDRKSSNGG